MLLTLIEKSLNAHYRINKYDIKRKRGKHIDRTSHTHSCRKGDVTCVHCPRENITHREITVSVYTIRKGLGHLNLKVYYDVYEYIIFKHIL